MARAESRGLRARDYLRTVAAPARISGARVDEVLEQTGLLYAAGRRIRTFSLGMKQRLGIATALLGDTDHFVLDEPINGLDPEGVIWVRGLLRDLASEGRCVLLSSHLMPELKQCVDDLVIIQNGRLVAKGHLAEIMSTHEHTVVVDSADNGRLIEKLVAAARTPPATGINSSSATSTALPWAGWPTKRGSRCDSSRKNKAASRNATSHSSAPRKDQSHDDAVKCLCHRPPEVAGHPSHPPARPGVGFRRRGSSSRLGRCTRLRGVRPRQSERQHGGHTQREIREIPGSSRSVSH